MKNLRKIICLLAVFVLMLSSAVTASASTVTYKNQADQFVFAPGSEYSLTDLFTNFKGVMPGDQLSQQVTVKNEASKRVDVEIFMRALGATDLQNPEDGIAEVSAEESTDFLKEMTLTVVQEGNSTLFEAPANETAQLTDWVSLGKFKSGAEVDLLVTLNVPITMGNDYQERIGALDWQFKVVEYPIAEDEPTPVEPDTPNETKTGDDFNMMIPAAVMAAAVLVILAIVVGRRKEKE